MKKRIGIIFVTLLALVLASSAVASAEFVRGFENNCVLEPGWIGVDEQGLPTTMPIFTYGSSGYITERVWVEVPCDTDRDGKRDRISIYTCRPVTKDGFLCPVVMEFDTTNYTTILDYSRMSNYISSTDPLYRTMAQSFKYHDNYPLTIGINTDTTDLEYDDIKYKGTEAWDPIWWSTDDAFKVDSWYTGQDYNGAVPAATIPTGSGTASTPYSWVQEIRNQQLFVRGYALASIQSFGSRDGEGITSTMHVEEWISAAAAVKWFNGETKGYTTRFGSVEVEADWANGHVAGTSASTLLAAMSGASGLKAIWLRNAITSWYELYRSGGSLHNPGGYGGDDINLIASNKFHRFNSDVGGNNILPLEIGPNFDYIAQLAYAGTQQYMIQKQDRATGDYNTEWDVRNLTRGFSKIPSDVGILQSNDQQGWYIMPKSGFLTLQAMRDSFGGTHKMVSGFNNQDSRLVPGKDGVERGMVKWYLMFLDHFLLGLDNKVDELMYDINIADNITGIMQTYDYNASKEERGTILPGSRYQRIYLTKGPEGKAGRLSYIQPQAAKEHFTDLDIHAQIDAPPHLGAPAKPSQVIPFNNIQGNLQITSAQANYCEDRLVGVNRTVNLTAETILDAVDKPVTGRLLYLSEPLADRVQLSGSVVAHLLAAPDRGMGNLSVALLEIGRKAYVGCRAGYSFSTTGETIVFPAVNGAAAISASRYGNPVGTSTNNFKYVTWGHTDVQNPSYDGKAWFDVPEQNYIPNYYFQTTEIDHGQYYNYVVELNPYNYTFEKGNRIAVMVYGSDPSYSPLLTSECTAEFDLQLGSGSYIDIPLRLTEAEDAVVIKIGNVAAAPDGKVDVTYTITGNDYGFSNLDLKIPYNSSVYTPVAVTASGGLNTPFFVFNPNYSPGLMRVAFASQDNVMDNDGLFTVTYQIDASAPGTAEYPLNLEPIKMQYNGFMDKLIDLEVVIEKGALILGIPGDIDGNGLVTPEDAMLLLQMIVGLIDWTPRAQLLGDINGDGLVDTTDAALILRMVVGA